MRAVVCDDDPVLRGVVADLITELGGTVIAETDAAIETVTLIDRFEPDVVVLDLNLRHGTGVEVLDAIGERRKRPHVVVFTAYDTLAPVAGEGVDVVHKPDFERLSGCLSSVGERPRERRRPPARPIPSGPSPVADQTGFYRVLNEAAPTDVLVSVPAAPGELQEVAAAMRTLVRGHDHVVTRSGDVLVLLVGGGPEGVDAVRARVAAKLPALADGLRCTEVGTDPVDAYNRLGT
jgi:CheY-like chemotaxis protein